MKDFDTIVIGKGLIGSAAAKYLSVAGSNVGVIGPDEPVNYNDSIVFGSHFDQGRVQRIIGKDIIWTRLNYDSSNQYEKIQEQTGIHFHTGAGCLYVNPRGADNYVTNAEMISKAFQVPFKKYFSAGEITKDFTDFNFPAKAMALLEPPPAGFINPRLLIKAQLNIFEQQNGIILKETVIAISFSGNRFCIKTHEGNSYFSANILLATGSFLNYFNLVPRRLALKSKSEVVLLARVSKDSAVQLSRLPSLLYEIDDGETEGIYLVPPILYTDGGYYLKIGCNMPEDIFFENIEQVQQWFRNGDTSPFEKKLRNALQLILPGLQPEAFATKKCIISRTVHGRPYIGGTSQPGLYVAGGCNGYSAMCSDAIGNIASQFMINRNIPGEYAADSFKLHYN